MGLFDYFTKESTVEKKPKATHSTQQNINAQPIQPNENTPQNTANNPSIGLFYPKSYKDVFEIIDFLRLNKPAVVHMNNVKNDTIQRIVDILSGACYALHCTLTPIQNNTIFMISPQLQVM